VAISLRRPGWLGVVSVSGWVVLCRLGSEGGSDRVEVDEDGGPDGLERRLALPEVAALAPPVAVDDESEQPFDSWSGAREMVAFGGIG
jgi:hypothetical protein